ncbi:MAG TPA: hypothetical protein VJ083_01930 [Sedimentibacter sp.]|nr:hypothetical protein [Sedimentibacter sp.]
MDFVFDRTEDDKPLKILTLVDDYSKECLWLEVARGISGENLCEILDFVMLINGKPTQNAYIESEIISWI